MLAVITYRKSQANKVDQTYFSPKTEKRLSAIEGRGLFAKAPIAKDEIVVVKGGYVMTTDQRNTVAASLGPAEIQIAEDLHMGPTTLADREGGMMHLNHSCEPNLGLQGQIVFVALRAIATDEELTFDYAMTDDAPHDTMRCHCGAASCRGTVTGRDWQRADLQRKYDGYFSWYIQRRIDAQKPGGDTSR
jgi:uncharacterized protein